MSGTGVTCFRDRRPLWIETLRGVRIFRTV